MPSKQPVNLHKGPGPHKVYTTTINDYNSFDSSLTSEFLPVLCRWLGPVSHSLSCVARVFKTQLFQPAQL